MPVVKLNARNITTLPAIAGMRTDYRDEAFLSSKEAMAWRPKTRQEFERILRVEVIPAPGHLKPNEVKWRSIHVWGSPRRVPRRSATAS